MFEILSSAVLLTFRGDADFLARARCCGGFLVSFFHFRNWSEILYHSSISDDIGYLLIILSED